MNSLIQDYINGKRLLITGASGYLASNLAKFLKEIPCTVRRITRKPGLTPLNGNAIFEDIQGDIRDSSLWDRAMEAVDIVFHFAGQTSVYVADKDPVCDYQANVLPMLLMLEACKKNDVHPDILFAGTSTIVGLPEELPVNETFPDQPVTIYDAHKLMAETYLKCYARMGLARGVTLRLTNVYGSGPKSSSEDRGIINMMVNRALSGKNLTVYGEGKFIRDYVYVDDVLLAFLMALVNMDQLNEKHFVLGSGEGNSISKAFHQVADRVAQKTGIEVKVDHIHPPTGLSPIEGRNFIADPRSFTEITGWEPQYSLSEGIDRTLDSFRAQAE
jgi:nucleoside-diphosphate-sugar epimerase